METRTMPGRALATLAGIAFAIGGLTILLDKQLLHPFDWASSQWLTIQMVFGAIAAGHLMVTAAKANHWPSAGGFGLLFVVGTGLVVYSSVGRQVETTGASTLSAEDTNARIADKTSDLKAAKARRDFANKAADREMTGQRCLQRCKDWKTNAKDITVVIEKLEAEIDALGPKKPVNAQAEAMADILLLFPIRPTKDQLIALLTLLVPFAKTLFFEIGSIVSLGFAFRPRPFPKTFSEIKAETLKNVVLPPSSTFSGEQPDPTPPTGPRGGRKTTAKRFSENVVPIRGEKHPVERALEKNGGSVNSNHQLAVLMGVSDGEASKRWPEIVDRLIVTRDGKHVRFALKSYAAASA